MKLMIDTNILISALVWPQSTPAIALLHATTNYELILCDTIIHELYNVVERKWPHLLGDADVFLAELPYELIAAPKQADKLVHDPKDQPILNAAILAQVDIIISGDKHFLKAGLEHPRVLTAVQYLEEFKIE
ncbi:MAG: putative toxin-antitoxin system toxin component, PIN family [Dethiobacter sp.]|jgi:putative PIN family toxin of toxin-antitoxin system|nr:putative toxin-antitoxin system toxin component, PIN family [Dethiobacter sp.]